jgi:CheY-like chemotaxis protein
MKILFVDDLVPWRKLLVELFKEDGSDYEIRQAGDGVEAMGILSQEYMPDMIISDMRMPRMNGHELLMNVRSNDRLSAIPFVMLSSAPCDKVLIKDHDCKATTHIPKPQDIDGMRSLISNIKRMMTEQRTKKVNDVQQINLS